MRVNAIAVWAGALLLTAAPAMSQAQFMRRLSADIPAEPLPQALRALAEQTGLRIVYVHSVVGERRSGATGKGLEAHEALAQVLEGTGLRYEVLTASTVKIVPSSAQLTGVAPPLPVTEEVVISKDVTERTERVSDTVRRTEVDVENTAGTDRALRFAARRLRMPGGARP